MNHEQGHKTAADFLSDLEGLGVMIEMADIATLLQTEPREATVDAIEARPAAAPAAMRITKIDTAALDHLLAPYIRFGVLSTAYHAATRATVYTSPQRRVIALSIGADHFAHADAAYDGMLKWAPHSWTDAKPGHHSYDGIGALAKLVADIDVPAGIVSMPPPGEPSLALHMQQIGRATRSIVIIDEGHITAKPSESWLDIAARFPRCKPVQWVLKNPRTGEIIPGSEFTSARDWAESMLNRGDAK
jgi:hypothetical protein